MSDKWKVSPRAPSRWRGTAARLAIWPVVDNPRVTGDDRNGKIVGQDLPQRGQISLADPLFWLAKPQRGETLRPRGSDKCGANS
jgi:hypothetical protein